MITNNTPIEIHKSKTNIFFLLLGALAFVIASTWIFTFPSMFRKIVAVLGFVFFGFCAFWLVRKLFDRTPSIIIDTHGIYDNSSASSIGLIEWDDIHSFSVGQISSQKFILIFVHDPDKYINKAENSFKRQMMKANSNLIGTPLSISALAMKCSLIELLDLFTSNLEQFRTS